MSRRQGRAGPSDPLEILHRRVQERAARLEAAGDAAHAEKLRARNPGEWGVSAEIVRLDTSNDTDDNFVELARDIRGQLVAAKRSDAFDLLHSGGGLSDEQHRASRRLFRDMALAAGVRDYQDWLRDHIDGGLGDPGAPTQVMIDASRRVNVALSRVGPVSAKILRGLNEPMIAGEVRPWRAIVQRLSGEKDRNAQAALVRQACEGLVLVYRDIDELARRLATEAKASADLRPFSTFHAVET